MEPATDAPVCYRHPDRQTRLSCSECSKPVCYECSTDAAVGQKCPDCSRTAGRNRVITARDVRRRAGAGSLPPVTMAILVLSVGAFLFGDNLTARGLLSAAAVADGEWYRLVTSAFLHSGFRHILFNMWALFILGPAIERQVGSGAFAGLYLASAVMGSAFFVALEPAAPAVGASGAVFGLFGAWLASSIRTRHTPAGRANLQLVGVLLGINLLLPFFSARIAWQAHLGGLVAGFLITLAWARFARDERTRTLIAAAMGIAGLVLAILVV